MAGFDQALRYLKSLRDEAVTVRLLPLEARSWESCCARRKTTMRRVLQASQPMTHNRSVQGSSPRGPTRASPGTFKSRGFINESNSKFKVSYLKAGLRLQ